MTEDQIARLSDELVEVGARLDAIATRLRHLGVPTPPAPPAPSQPHPAAPPPAPPPGPFPGPLPGPLSGIGPMPAPPQLVPAAPEPAPGWMAPPVPPVPPVPPMAPEPAAWRRPGFGSRAVAWVGGAVTLAGVVLLLVLAIQRGYLGPLPRVLLGAGLGLGLVGVGWWLHRDPRGRTGAFAVAATGFAVLYLDVVAATSLHGFLPPAAGLAGGLVVAAAGLLLAARWASQALAVFVVLCCAVCAPVLTAGFVPLLLGFLLVLPVGATPVHLTRRWPGLCLAATVPPVLVAVVTIATTLRLSGAGSADARLVAYLALATSLVQVVVAVAAAVRELDDVAFGLVLLAPAPALLAALLVSWPATVVLPGTVAVGLVLTWVLARVRVLLVSDRFAVAAGAAGLVAAAQATLAWVDRPAAGAVLLAWAGLLTLLAHRLRYPAALAAGAVFAVVGLGFVLADAVPPRLVAVAPTAPVPTDVVLTMGGTGLLLAGVAVAMVRVRWVLRTDPTTGRPAVVAGAGVALYGAAAAVLAVGLAVSPDRDGFLLGHVLVTVSWAGAALVPLAARAASAAARAVGLALVAAALAKLVLYDLSSLDGLARVSAFLAAGLVLLAAGVRYARPLAERTADDPS